MKHIITMIALLVGLTTYSNEHCLKGPGPMKKGPLLPVKKDVIVHVINISLKYLLISH